MTNKDQIVDQYLDAQRELGEILLEMRFIKDSSSTEGLPIITQYHNQHNTIVKFLFGPPGWEIDMIIYSRKGKFEFKDLLGINRINDWVKQNRYVEVDGRNLINELLWFVKLMQVALPYIE